MHELSEVSGLWSVRESGRVKLQTGDLRSEAWGEIDKSTNQQINKSTHQQINTSTNQQFNNSTN